MSKSQAICLTHLISGCAHDCVMKTRLHNIQMELLSHLKKSQYDLLQYSVDLLQYSSCVESNLKQPLSLFRLSVLHQIDMLYHS